MAAHDLDPVSVIERALVRIRRDQQARRLQRRDSAGDPVATSVGSAARFRYLDALDGIDGGLPISQIADAIDVDRPRASRLTRELLTDGMVVRTTDPDDSRYARIRLSDRGRDLVGRVRRTRRRAVAEALDGFSDADAATLAALLDRFVDAWPRSADDPARSADDPARSADDPARSADDPARSADDPPRRSSAE